jgi:hypothetical protein
MLMLERMLGDVKKIQKFSGYFNIFVNIYQSHREFHARAGAVNSSHHVDSF